MVEDRVLEDLSYGTRSFYRSTHDRLLKLNATAEMFFDALAAWLPESWSASEKVETGLFNGRPFLSMKTEGKRSLVFVPKNWEIL
jgi:hypothetical protein